MYTSWVIFQVPKVVTWICSAKKVYLKKLQDILKKTSAQVFFCRFCKIFYKRCFIELVPTKICFWSNYISGHLQMTTSQQISFLIISTKKNLKNKVLTYWPTCLPPTPNFLSENDVNQTLFPLPPNVMVLTKKLLKLFKMFY